MIRSLFARKPIEALLAEGENPNGLRRVLGAGDLIMLAIGAVIGAGSVVVTDVPESCLVMGNPARVIKKL